MTHALTLHGFDFEIVCRDCNTQLGKVDVHANEDGIQLHSKKWKKLRPSFDPVEWRDLSTPSQNPSLPAPQADALPGTKVEEPSLSEKMGGDAVPWSDPIDDILDAPTKPEMTKRGVQKIAGR